MTTEGDQPQAENGANKGAKKHHCWQRARMFARCFGCWIFVSVRNPDNIPIYLTAIFTAFLATFAYYAWDEATRGTRAMQGQLDVLKDDFSYAHRPHFRIRFANIEHTGDKIFTAGKPVRGTIEILNNGQATAEIFGSHLEVYWSNTGLPASFPNLPAVDADREADQNEFACGTRGQHGVRCEIGPGPRQKGHFDSRTSLPEGGIANNIETGKADWKLYLLGWISYRGIRDHYTRHFDFAEVYESKRRRFFPVTNDPDYAYDPDAK
jgi:hypothetical protein